MTDKQPDKPMTKVAPGLHTSADADNGRPEAQPVDFGKIPAVLKAADCWVVWRYVEDVDEDTGEVNWTKPPVNARTGRLASSTNPQTWSKFVAALIAYRRGSMDGVGFVLQVNDGDDQPAIVAIDLDHCRDPETGVIDNWAMQIIRKLNSYTEVSPSGAGIRVFVLGRLPPKGRKKGRYENYETSRYVTVTGQHVNGSPLEIEHRQAELETVHRDIFGDPGNGQPVPGQRGLPTDMADPEIVERATKAKNGAIFRRLWEGDINGHNSHSEADLALCNHLAFWCGPDEDHISDLFRQSGLYRPKWDRDDYRSRTIAKALAGRTDFYEPPVANTPQTALAVPTSSQIDCHEGKQDIAVHHIDGHLTDRGNAIRLVQHHGNDLRYCLPWKKWLVWDGVRWHVDNTGAPMRYAKQTVAALHRWAVDQLAKLEPGMG